MLAYFVIDLIWKINREETIVSKIIRKNVDYT